MRRDRWRPRRPVPANRPDASDGADRPPRARLGRPRTRRAAGDGRGRRRSLSHGHRAAAAEAARGADPLRGAALLVGRGGTAAGHDRRRGEQRAAAGPGHPARRATGFRWHGGRPLGSARPSGRCSSATSTPSAGTTSPRSWPSPGPTPRSPWGCRTAIRPCRRRAGRRARPRWPGADSVRRRSSARWRPRSARGSPCRRGSCGCVARARRRRSRRQ